MIKQYIIDENKKNELINTQYKKHPKWKKHKKVRMLILMTGFILPIIIELYAVFKAGKTEIFSDYFFIELGVFWTLMIGQATSWAKTTGRLCEI